MRIGFGLAFDVLTLLDTWFWHIFKRKVFKTLPYWKSKQQRKISCSWMLNMDKAEDNK